MTKSLALIIGDQPEDLLLRRQKGYSLGSENVTSELRDLVGEIVDRPSPSGINPSIEFKRKLAVKTAIHEFFGYDHCQIYDSQREKPEAPITHNCIVLDDGEIVAAYRRLEASPDKLSPSGLPFNHPFDYWWEPRIAYLPLRSNTHETPYDSQTDVSEKDPYYSDWTSSNSAILADIDLETTKQARYETTVDLLSQAKRILAAEGLDERFDWQPRYTTDWGDTKENAFYFEQIKPKLLHERMPDHAKRIDYLRVGEADLMLYSNWGAIPVANVLSQDGYASTDNYYSEDSSQDALFFQVTGTNRKFLKTLRDVFVTCAPDTLFSIYGAHE